MNGYYEQFIVNNSSTEPASNEEIKNNTGLDTLFSTESLSEEDINGALAVYKSMCSYGTMMKNTIRIKDITSDSTSNIRKEFSLEADDDNPFDGMGDGLDSDEDLPDGGSGDDDSISFDSFEDATDDADSVFGSSDEWGDDDSNDETKKQALEVSRSDLLDESHNLGISVRKVIPKKIYSLIDIIDYNISIINKNIFYSGKYHDSLKFVKDTYEDIKQSVKDYLDVIDSKTFSEIFSEYVVLLSLIDNANDLYKTIIKKALKNK